MERLGVEDPSDVSVVDKPGGDPLPETVPTSLDEPRQEREEPASNPATPVAEQVKPVSEQVAPASEQVEPASNPATPVAEQVKPVSEQVEPVTEHEEPLAEVRRLEVELERYREHAQRTSKLFLSVTNYVEWVRENARRDAELALRKARAKVEKLERTARELERTERELARVQDELARLQALTDETRARLSTFLTAGLQVLNGELAAGQDDSPNPALGDLQDTLQERLASTSVPASAQRAEVEGPAL